MAEDLAQETFVKVYLKLAAFDTTRRLSSWVFRIAHNTAIDAMRRSRRGAVAAGDAELQAAASPSVPPDPVETEALGRALEAAMAQLRPEQRAAITLRYDEGMSFEDIGHVLGVPAATARSHVHRARKELAAHLTAAGWQPSKT